MTEQHEWTCGHVAGSMGLICITRSDDDERQIVKTWL